MMAKKTGSRGLGKLFAEATRDFPMHDRHDMLSEILPQMTPLPRDLLLDILGSATMGSTEIQFMLMQRLHESVAPSLRGEMMVELFTVRRWLSIPAALCGFRQSLLPLSATHPEVCGTTHTRGHRQSRVDLRKQRMQLQIFFSLRSWKRGACVALRGRSKPEDWFLNSFLPCPTPLVVQL